MTIKEDAAADAWTILDDGKPVLRYNHGIVPLPEDVAPKIAAGNKKYAVARADYIHPLYGLSGEVLTNDWVPDHPHHRGIYWAWPEVDWQGKRGDLHALQNVFARPIGKVRTETTADFALVEGQSEWRWEDKTPIVTEVALIRAFHANDKGRLIDFEFRFTAIDADVQVARRGQNAYGGLNLRFSPSKHQELRTFNDANVQPQRTWGLHSGIRDGQTEASGIGILQHISNPDYPGEWVKYPDLPWLQPTFPAKGTRYTITKDKPLVLKYRLWIHKGAADDAALGDQAAVYNGKRQ
ncbi:MAG TPA: DUF6807 family protein [Planctomycetota bacterium]